MKLQGFINMINKLNKKINHFLKNRNVYFVLFALMYISFISLFYMTLPFGRLNYTIYLFGFLIMLLLISIFGVLLLEGIFENNKKFKLIGVLGSIVFFLVFSIGNYYIYRVSNSINNVIVGTTEETVLNLSFVTYENDTIEQIEDINNVNLGILANTDIRDNNSYVKSIIEQYGLNVSYIEFHSYNEMILALFAGNIDVATLRSDYYSQFEGNDGYLDYLEKTNSIYSFSTTLITSNEEDSIDVSKEAFSILIMGNDGERTDAMILATYNPITLSVTMTSIPRDSYIPIACYPESQKDKLAHAGAVSRECVVDTIANLFDIEIDYYVSVNFQGVVDIVDALDRIWLESSVSFVGQNSSEERGHYTIYIPEGGFWATGEMALSFARERHAFSDGDYQRQENQQQVIESMISRVLSLSDVNQAVAVLQAAGENIKTNISLNNMISIFNTLINASIRTGVETSYVLDIIGSRVMGYSSYTYNDELQLPLWIMKPYEGSVEDLRNLMLSNLMVDIELPSQVNIFWDASKVLYSTDYFSFDYNEDKVHEELPDFMPQMAYSDWTWEKARDWAKTRKITLNVTKVEDGDLLYVSDYSHNYIVGQSIRYGIKTSNFSSLDIKVIKHNLDCSIEENMQYEECIYLLPDFIGKTISKAVTWADNINLDVRYNIITEDEDAYDKNLIGYVIDQNPSSWNDVRTLSRVTLTVMDSVYSVVLPTDISTWTEIIARQWVTDNLQSEDNILVTYTPTVDKTLIGKVKSIGINGQTTIKNDETLPVVIYNEGYSLVNYEGQLKTFVDANICTQGLVICKFNTVLTTDSTLNGVIMDQDLEGLKLKTVWATTKVTFVVYEYQTSTP